MRRLRGELRRSACLFLMWLLPGPVVDFAQVQQPTLPTPPGQNAGRVPFGEEPNQDPTLRHAEDQAAKKRNIDRQNRMRADSDRICALAQEFSEEINKGGDGVSPAALRKVEEIEKLAKGVKERMRSD